MTAETVSLSPTDLLSPSAAAAYSGYSESTLAKFRCFGQGPRYLKPSTRKILYRRADIDNWLAQFQQNSTAENKAAAQ